MILSTRELAKNKCHGNHLMIKYLLDTNICIYVIKNRPIEVLSKFNEAAGKMAISSITLAELLHGCEKVRRLIITQGKWKIFVLGLMCFNTETVPRNIMEAA